MADVLAELEEVHAEKIAWNGGTYPVIASSRRIAGKLGDGGFGMEADASFAVRAELFAQLPQQKQPLTFKRFNTVNELVESVRYQIDQVITLPGGDIVRLVCVLHGKGV